MSDRDGMRNTAGQTTQGQPNQNVLAKDVQILGPDCLIVDRY